MTSFSLYIAQIMYIHIFKNELFCQTFIYLLIFDTIR